VLVERTEERRLRAAAELEPTRRSMLGQFFTPAPVAVLLAGMFDPPADRVRLLDAGAGVGSLTAALISRASTERWSAAIAAHAVELDENLLPSLKETLHECEIAVPTTSSELHAADFIEWACDQLGSGLFADEPARFELAILNPPYRKLNTASRERQLLSAAGVETTNLYAAFVTLALRLLVPGGQLVAITPRSFCNGPYFKAFRRELLETSALRRIHVFESRDKAFRDAEVLQENVIIHVVKGTEQRDVVVASSGGSGSESVRERRVPFANVVHVADPNAFIHVVPEEAESDVAERIRSLACRLGDLDASVSTGRVVDFRTREHLRMESGDDTVPLLYPVHLRDGRVRWPTPNGKKPNALVAGDATRRLLLPNGNYVLVKRFSSKEERRRVVATVLECSDLACDQVAIENHVNVFHHRNAGLPLDLAWGIAAYLNSAIVDVFFRQFNGHTQVNATDLRSLRYPSIEQLVALGSAARLTDHEQTAIDALVERVVPELAGA
jgi:adenine-specific DNA-methyltransferase